MQSQIQLFSVLVEITGFYGDRIIRTGIFAGESASSVREQIKDQMEAEYRFKHVRMEVNVAPIGSLTGELRITK